ncbi:MAG TPA: carboxypeptidase-like regulatory domain-containing protein [Terriglobales bacterium]|nr:carboxypeptidase-like regulatory domain-containing protein [Terriglobales bacterium]
MRSKLGYLVIAFGLALPSWCADRAASISGYIHSSNGAPQIGAIVEVIGSAAAGTFRFVTDDKGFFHATGLIPGTYSVKASAPAFLPTLREKISVKAGASVLLNLTLSTIFDALQISPRRGTADDGDWNWVLRSAADRPVLRILPDGSPVMVADKNTSSDLKGTLSFVAGAPSQGFGSISDMSTGFLVEKSMFANGTLTVNGDLGYGSAMPNAVFRSSYKRRMANGSTPEIALTMRRLSAPDLGVRNAQMEALALTASNDVSLGDVLELKFGSELQTIQFLGKVTAFRPFGKVAAHLSPDTVVEYKYSTSRPDGRAEKGFETAPADLSESDPRLSMVGFTPALERAHHQEVALSHREGNTSMQAAFYSDRLVNPALTGVGEFSSSGGDVLPDVYSGTFSYEGRNLDTRGLRLVLEQQLTSDVTATVNYSFGGVVDFDGKPATIEQVRADGVTRNRHALTGKLSGITPHTKTRWIASYGWTSGRALTPVDMFNASAGQADPFLDVFLRQPVPCTRSLPGHMDIVVEVRNLLAQGYVPVFGQDGRTVYLVQSARAVRGGLAFSF